MVYFEIKYLVMDMCQLQQLQMIGSKLKTMIDNAIISDPDNSPIKVSPIRMTKVLISEEELNHLRQIPTERIATNESTNINEAIIAHTKSNQNTPMEDKSMTTKNTHTHIRSSPEEDPKIHSNSTYSNSHNNSKNDNILIMNHLSTNDIKNKSCHVFIPCQEFNDLKQSIRKINQMEDENNDDSFISLSHSNLNEEFHIESMSENTSNCHNNNDYDNNKLNRIFISEDDIVKLNPINSIENSILRDMERLKLQEQVISIISI